MRGSALLSAMTALAVTMFPAGARAEVTVRDPGTFVVDSAGIIDAGLERPLEHLLLELQQKTTAQIKVLTVPTTEGEDFFGWVQRHAELWKLGARGKDNGVLIALAVEERRVRIHTGYGLEAVLPDSWCGTLRRKVTKDHLSRNEFGLGLAKMAVTIANKVASAANARLAGTPGLVGYRSVRSPRVVPALCGGGLLPFVIMMIILSSLSRRRRHYGRWGGGGLLQGLFWGSVLSSTMRGGRSGWGGGFGGGFGGGGFGGGGFFGGGGGFGGGGSGGSF